MTQLSASALANLRKRPQSTKLYLSIYQPKTIFQTRVTGTYIPGDAQISYYATTTGSYQNIYPNLVARIGSSRGGNEYGELRVRNASGTYITFAENELGWQQGMWLTLIDYIDITAIYPRIIQDPNNQTNVIFYKDYDIPYSNQNTIYGTFPCAGPHRAGFIITGAYSSYWSSTGTYNVNGDSLTYSWAFEGGTPTGSTAKDPGYVRYTTPGHYKTRLITTSSSGAVDVAYRYISVYQKPNQGTFNPIEAWDISELSGSRGEGGYTARIKIMSILPEIQPKALIVIWAEDTYGGNQISIGGNSQNNESIVFTGYILQDSIRFNYQQSTMEFDVGSVSELMKESEGFSVSCESKATATTWYELQEMTIQKALYHYLRWHSTILNVADFQFTGADRYVQYLDTDRESLFDAVDNFMRKGLLGSVISDRQGKLWAQISHFGSATPFSSIPLGMVLNKQDWMGDPTIHERRGYDTSFIELGGIAYYGVSTNTFSALLSNAPGPAPLYRGKIEREEGLILVSQAQLNQVAANYLAYRNTQFNEVTMPINGNYRNLDIAPQERQYLVISQSDTIRNVNLQGRPFQITSMNWTYNSVNESFYPDIVMEQMATGTMAQTVLIPAVPPYENSGYDYPNLQLPTLPVFNPSSSVGVTTTVILHDTAVGLLYTSDFDAGSPFWYTVNGGLTSTQYQNINWIGICPNGAIYVAFLDYGNADSFIARAPNIGGLFTVMNVGASILCAAVNPTATEEIAFLSANNADANAVFHVGNYASWNNGSLFGGAYFFFDDPRALSWGDSSWLMTRFSFYAVLSQAGTTTSSGAPDINPGHLRAGVSGRTYHNYSGPLFIKGEDNLTSNTTVYTATEVKIDDFSSGIIYLYTDCDPTGQFLMGRTLVGNKAKSSDFGATWLPLPNLPPAPNYCFAYAGANGAMPKFVAANSVVRYSPDFGASWIGKEGNLITDVPLLNVNIVKVVGSGQP